MSPLKVKSRNGSPMISSYTTVNYTRRLLACGVIILCIFTGGGLRSFAARSYDLTSDPTNTLQAEFRLSGIAAVHKNSINLSSQNRSKRISSDWVTFAPPAIHALSDRLTQWALVSHTCPCYSSNFVSATLGRGPPNSI